VANPRNLWPLRGGKAGGTRVREAAARRSRTIREADFLPGGALKKKLDPSSGHLVRLGGWRYTAADPRHLPHNPRLTRVYLMVRRVVWRPKTASSLVGILRPLEKRRISNGSVERPDASAVLCAQSFALMAATSNRRATRPVARGLLVSTWLFADGGNILIWAVLHTRFVVEPRLGGKPG